MLIERWVQPAGIHVELQTWGVVDLRGCFIWTSWCSWAEGHCLWTSPRKAGMSTALPLMGCFWRSSSNNQGSLQATAVLTHSVLPLFLSLLFGGGGRGLWKRSNILAEVLMMLEIQLWTLDPGIPLSKMRPPNWMLGSLTAPSQNPALGRVCLLKH